MSTHTTNSRIIWVDICRLLCIFPVIYLHSIFLPHGYTSPWTGLILGPSYDFTRPMAPVLVFFFLSGWLQKPKSKYLETKKAILLFAPAILFWNGLQLLIQPEPVCSWKDILYNMGIFPCFKNANEPLWFLSELMWFTLLLPLIHRIPVQIRIAITIILLWFAAGYYSTGHWGLDERITYTAFFLGGTVAHNLDRTNVCHFFQKTAIWFVLLTFYIFYSYFIPGAPDIPLTGTMKSSAIAPIVALMSFFGVSILFSKFFAKLASILANWAPAVFFLYASHWPVFTLYERFALHYQIPPPHPHILPVVFMAFMLVGIGIWKIGQKIPYRTLRSIIFLQTSRKANTD